MSLKPYVLVCLRGHKVQDCVFVAGCGPLEEEFLQQVKNEIKEQVDRLAEDLFGLSRLLYENPETAYEEHQACQWLSQFLAERGFEVEKGAGGVETAFAARYAGGNPDGPSVAFLAEYDALPKIGHGCGHNLIAASSIGAGIALVRAMGEIPGRIAVMGTPAEEGGGGKARMIDGGAFEGIDIGLLSHPGHHNQAGEGSLGRIKAKIEFFGKTAHAASSPEAGRNALDAIIGSYNNICALRQQIPADAKLHGIITHGGDAPNIIPDYTAGLYYVRSGRRDYLKELFQRFEDCCHGAARAAGCECRIEVQPPSLEPTKRNYTLERMWEANLEDLGMELQVKNGPSGSSDVGNLSQVIPVLQSRLAIAELDVPIHSKGYADATQSERGRKALLDAAKTLAMTAYDYLVSAEARRAVAEEFANTPG